MTAPKKKMRRRLHVVDVIRELIRNVMQELRTISSQISGLGNMIDTLKSRIPDPRNAAGSSGLETFRTPQKVTVWLIAEPDPPRPAFYVDKSKTITNPNELANVLFDLTQRVHTLNATGRLAILTFDEGRGALELHSRERVP